MILTTVMETKPLPSLETLREYLRYHPDTGILTWVKKPATTIPVGSVAGGKNLRGYLTIGFGGNRYMAHRIIWKMVYGNDPDKGKVIDHINRIKDDNRFCNLRLVSYSENNINRDPNQRLPEKSGIRGILWNKRRHCYVLRINEKFIAASKSLEEVKYILQQYDNDNTH